MMEDTRRARHSESTEQDANGLIDTESTSTGCIRIYTGPPVDGI